MKISLKTILFTLIGGLIGFLYAYFVGCKTGTCPVTSNKYIATLFMALFGFILSLDNGKNKKEKGENNNVSNQ
jgi:uncharacterized protein YacL